MSIELVSAIRRGDLNEVLRLIPEHDINEVHSDEGLLANQTYLEIACLTHHIDIIIVLLENGATFTTPSIVRVLTNMNNDYHGANIQILRMQIIDIMLENGVDYRYFEEAFNINIDIREDNLFLQIITELRNNNGRFNVFENLNAQDFVEQIYGFRDYRVNDNININESVEVNQANQQVVYFSSVTSHANDTYSEFTSQELSESSTLVGSIASFSQQSI